MLSLLGRKLKQRFICICLTYVSAGITCPEKRKHTMMIDLVVFDLAGTTVHDNKDVQRVLQNTMAKFDIYITPEEADNVMGIPKPVAIRQLLEKYSDDLIAVTD